MVFYLGKSHIKSFSIHSTALDVKKLLAKELVSQPPRAFDLYHHDVGSSDGHSKMRFLQRTLLNYRVKDGDEFYVELKSRDTAWPKSSLGDIYFHVVKHVTWPKSSLGYIYFHLVQHMT